MADDLSTPGAAPHAEPPDEEAGPPSGDGGEGNAHEIANSPDFKALVAKRWAVSFTLLVLLFVGYYGYILLIAADRELVSTKVGEVTTLAIPLGVGVIVVAWALTAAYVVWANRSYDPEVARIKQLLRKGRLAPPAEGPKP